MYAKIYESFGAKLPAPTLALMWVADNFSPIEITKTNLLGIPFFLPVPRPLSFGAFAFYIFVAVFVFRRRTRDNLEIGKTLDSIRFKLPVIGALAHRQSLQRWASTLAGGLATGVPMTKAIDLAAAASGSRWVRNLAPSLSEAIRTGRTISSEVAKNPELFPPSVRTMMSTGEDTGELDTMLDSVADALDSDIDALVAGLSAKIEVVLLLVLGGVVGGLLLVLYMPILQLATTASKGLSG
jgi:type IV pilus assembly protein PilC